MSSLISKNVKFSQYPSGLLVDGGMKVSGEPGYSPQSWSTLVTIDVPERCIPAIQTGMTLLVSVVFETTDSGTCPSRRR
jgi:hypothetical protein